MYRTLTAALPLALALSLSAQTRHLVGAGAFPDVKSALQIAKAGDEIVIISPGVFGPLEVRVGVTIRTRKGVNAILSRVECRAPAQQQTRFGHVELHGYRVLPGDGTVIFDSCRITPPAFPWPGAFYTVDRARVLYHNSRITGGLVANDSFVGLHGSRVAGPARSVYTMCKSTWAVVLHNSVLAANNAHIEGGGETWCTGRGESVGVRANGASVIRISQSTVAGGLDSNTVRSMAIDNGSRLAVRLDSTTIQGRVQGAVDRRASLLASRQLGGPLVGQSYSTELLGRGGMPYALIASGALAARVLPGIADIVWFEPSASAPLIGAGFLPPSGIQRYSVPIPAQTQLRGRTIWVHAVGLSSDGIVLALPSGGEVR